MTEYPAGTVAMVTSMNRSVPFRTFFDGKAWVEHGSPYRLLLSPTSVRPLVVLDLANPGRVVQILREYSEGHGWAVLDNLADQIEAQTQPPRIPEPGLWGVVEAHVDRIPRRRWVHHEEDRWVCDNGAIRYWLDLVDPTLVRPGIEDAS